MQVKQLPLAQAIGHILIHNQVGPDGRRLLRKGTRLTETEIETIRQIGLDQVYVAVLEPGDVDEDEAARRLADLLAGPGITVSNASTGRVNLIAQTAGVCRVNVEALLDFNTYPGITLATVPDHRPVQPKQPLGTIKIIPYSVPQSDLAAAEAVARNQAPLLEVKPFVVKQAALITTGSEASRDKVVGSFSPALQQRLATYGTDLLDGPYVAEVETDISDALQWALNRRVELILIAGETSIMDEDDITPRAIKAIGGQIIHHGVPVEPGNLLLLAYHDDVPIVGAPGCARSPSYNVIDMVLPRLIAKERLTRRALTALGHGGYLK